MVEIEMERWQIARVYSELKKADIGVYYVGYYLPIKGGQKKADIRASDVSVGMALPEYQYEFEVSLHKKWDVCLRADGNYGEFFFYMRPIKTGNNLEELIKIIMEE